MINIWECLTSPVVNVNFAQAETARYNYVLTKYDYNLNSTSVNT